MLLRAGHTRRETVTVLFGGQWAGKARNRAKRARFIRRKRRGSGEGDALLGGRAVVLHVQQIVAGKLRLVGDEGKARASALVPINRSTESAVPSRSSASSTTRSSLRLAGSMVVSLSCAGIISPRMIAPHRLA